jgi:hypothetical protein
MFCLVCEKRIPLHRQLAGSPFCSKEHREQHAGQSAASNCHAKTEPARAQFADSSPACALPEALPDTTAFHTPIPRFCDVILSRRRLKPRYTMGVAGARTVGWFPGPAPAPPETGRTIQPGPETRSRLRLGLPCRSPLDAARRLSAATSKDGAVEAATPSRARVHGEMGAGEAFQAAPWDASFQTRWLGASRAAASGPRRAAFGKYPDPPNAQEQPPQFQSRVAASIPFALKPTPVAFTYNPQAPGFRARLAAFLPSPIPVSAQTSLRVSGAAPLRPIERPRVPMSSAFTPALVGIRACGRIAATVPVADVASSPWSLAFRTALAIGGLENPPRRAALAGAGRIEESLLLAGSRAELALFAPASIPATILLPKPAASELPPRSKLLPSGTSALCALLGAVSDPIAHLTPEFHLAPRIGLNNHAAVPTALQALSGIAESFTMADMERVLQSPAPIPARAGLWLPESRGPVAPALTLRASIRGAVIFQPQPQASSRGEHRPAATPAPFPHFLWIPRETGNPDIGEFECDDSVPSIAGFAAEVWPSPLAGVFRPLHDSANFSLYPVWLPALFALGRPGARLRRGVARYPGPAGSAAGSENTPIEAEGPGFSGMLLFPERGSPYWEFRENWRPEVRANKKPRKVSTAANRWPHAMQNTLRIWRTVPTFARGLAIAVPLIAPALFYLPPISLPKLSSSDGHLAREIRARAMVDLREDFQTGLGNWAGQKGWESTWQVVASGSAQPGRLALFQPMTPLTDYRVEFQGQIQSKALGFVFRATDMNNYYAAKIVIRKPGALPSVFLVRYAVVGGHAGPKTETLLPMYLRSDTLYNVLVTVRGDSFTFTVNGQLVDTWSDDRLKSGGVGFFAEKGEISQIRSVHVVDNEDFLGWLCSEVSHWNADRTRIGVKHE